ncbi:P-loop containing nucleoside triphosphate hydrolase protein [Diplogelasinospora grovesii]|uniref:RNA helicase n=1 Tax=Diplogelasinospora grovesii TaxID=303347 RepID=A0AAN6NDL9_9PEZI|nr:P-loop containing nucleoside triphosphate hydrolase protein [Diplogelasinospora grovesii]
MKSLFGTAWKCSKSAVFVPRRCYRPAYSQRPPLTLQFTGFNARHLRDGLENDTPSTRRGRPPAPHTQRNYKLFQSLVNNRLSKVIDNMGAWTAEHDEYRAFGIKSQHELDRELGLFRRALNKSFDLASEKGLTGRQENPLFWNLRNAFVKADAPGLARELKYAFQTFMIRSRFPKAITELHAQLADLRYPYEWFPATRMMQRTIHLHVGPTNSGKTYNALKALENAKTGIYAGPLRLLAHEIYTRFQAKGKPCALITGEEQRIPEGVDQYFSSCTVEMSPLNTRVDVAVIDEIQMIADDERGWAWTQAFLGIQAKELHLCGEDRAVDLIQALCARIGDKCIVHRYERLNPLQTMDKSLDGRFANLQKGDAVVAFSRVALYTLKAGIEAATGRRCAIVYGSLPPETRAQQAALFNDPNNDYDFLVASDAIGMGLNLEIKRVIFESSTKFDGMAHRDLTVPEVKQIGGRAGRYRTASQDIASASTLQEQDTPMPVATNKWGTPGFVTTLDEEDLRHIQKAFQSNASPIKTAGTMPPAFIIERFYSYFPPNTPFNFVLSRLREMSRLTERFNMCSFADYIEIAEAIQSFPMSLNDRIIFLTAPVALRDPKQRDVLRAYARCVSELKGGHLLDIEEVDLEILDIDDWASAGLSPTDYLNRLEALHKAITLYLWLGYRYQGVFQSQHLAFHVKSLVEAKITDYLEDLTFEADSRKRRRAYVRAMAAKHRTKEHKLLEGDEGEEENHHEGPGQWKEEGHEEPLVEDKAELDSAKAGRAPGNAAFQEKESGTKGVDARV